MSMLGIKARTVWALGLVNTGRVAMYRVGVRTGANPVRRLKALLPPSPFFGMPGILRTDLPVREAWWHQSRYFGWWPLAVDHLPPDWHANPMTGKRVNAPERPWWRIPDFDPQVGDIKVIWEASRFDWVLAFAQRAATGDAEALARLNRWLEDWCRKNPAYRGPNWKCGQETSIRVMHLAMASLLLGQTGSAQANLLELIKAHLRRILPTLSYAMGQDNNHGTSEAAALFIGGSWLAARGRYQARRWERLGRRWLENRALRLIQPDGSVSQYSLNYHRMVLETFSMAEIWRRHLALPAFSPRSRERVAAGARWLAAMVDPETGDAPNLGANDGARLLPLADVDYRDFRPTVHLAMALFADRRAYPGRGTWQSPLTWLSVPVPDEAMEKPASRLFDEGGFAVLRRGHAMALLRYPRFRFRPGQADALHVDLWKDGENLLRDAGTYSYNTEKAWLDYFPGTASHNTVQFDDRDQMPRLSRFLFGDWLKPMEMRPIRDEAETVSVAAAYRDGQGATHSRDLSLSDDKLVVRDRVDAFLHKAILRWRLRPGDWRVDGHTLTDGRHSLSVRSATPIARFEIVQGWESRYYLQKTAVPVLEVEIREPGSLTSEYRWAA